MTSINDLIAEFANHAGWRWWGTCVALSFINLMFMYALDSPRSLGGRVARTLGYMAMIGGAFAWKWDSLGTLSYPLLLCSYLALNVQYWWECRVKKRGMTPVARESRVERVVASIVRNADDDHPRRAQTP
jgi:hypothetical protein